MEKLVPDPSLKKQIWAYPRINSLKTYSLLLLYVQVQVEEYQNTLRPRVQQHLLSLNTSYKAFLKKQKEVWNKSRFPIICMVFEEKHVSAYVLLTLLVLGWFVRLFMLRGVQICPTHLFFVSNIQWSWNLIWMITTTIEVESQIFAISNSISCWR